MLAGLTHHSFDLLVIGGGITGAGIAREAALRGLAVALVDRGDFAHGTSSRSTKLIHGGLRYLKQMDFKLVRESVQERMRLLEMAPHLVSVRKFLFPVYQGDPDALWKIRIGLTFYDLFAGKGNPVPHRIAGPAEILGLEPGLRRDGLVGGGVYLDCATDDGRLTLEVLKSASRHGAVVRNYTAVTSFLYDPSGQVRGARLRDVLTGEEAEVRAARVLAAAGPWADQVRRLDDPAAPLLLRLTKGVHLTVPGERLPIQHPVVMRGPDARMMFAVPTGGFTYVGTTDTDYHGAPEAVTVERSDAEYILAAVRRCFPGHPVSAADVTSAWAGLRPLLRPAPGKSPSETSRDYAVYTSRSGLITIAGGKLTAFRAMASHITDGIFPATKGRIHLDQSAAPLPGASGHGFSEAALAGLARRTDAGPAEVAARAGRYGSAFPDVVAELPAGAAGDRAWLLAQARFSVRHEWARRLEDVIARRSGALLFSRDNGRPHLASVAAEMGALLGWSAERTEAEVAHCAAEIDAMLAWRT